MQEAQNTKVVQDAYAAFGRGDIQTLLTYFADDIVWTLVYGAGSHVPTSGYGAARPPSPNFSNWWPRTCSSRSSSRRNSRDRDRVVALGHYEATTPIKKGFDSEFTMVFTFRNGKVAHFQESAIARPSMRRTRSEPPCNGHHVAELSTRRITGRPRGAGYGYAARAMVIASRNPPTRSLHGRPATRASRPHA